MKIEYRKITDLVEYEKNTRTHSNEQIAQITASMKEFGFTNPVLIDGNNRLIAGHGRVKAAPGAGFSEVPCIVIDHLSDDQVRALVIADNQLALNAGWDEDLLAQELQLLEVAGFDLGIVGFDADALAGYLSVEDELAVGLVDDEAIPEVSSTEVSRLGDIWLLGDHRLMCGSSTDIDQVSVLINTQKIDLVFSDPPYGIDAVQGKKVGGGGEKSFGQAGSGDQVESKEYSKIIGDNSTATAKDFYNTCLEMGFKNIVLWGGNYFTDFLYPSRCWVVWDKQMTGNFSEAEMAWTSFKKGGISVFKYLWNGLLRQGNRKDELVSRVHPTQKPVGLFVDIFERFDGFKTIYDGFGGSGTTMISCEKIGRQCYMMEIDPHYIDVIIRRWQDWSGKEAIRGSDGITFNKLAALNAHG